MEYAFSSEESRTEISSSISVKRGHDFENVICKNLLNSCLNVTVFSVLREHLGWYLCDQMSLLAFIHFGASKLSLYFNSTGSTA